MNSGSFYDLITNFKLQANTILNNPTNLFDFNSSSPISQLLLMTTNSLMGAFGNLMGQISNNYINDNNSQLKYYIIIYVCLVVITLPFLFRIYIINRRLNV